MLGFEGLAAFEFDAGDFAVFREDAFHSRTQSQFAAKLAVLLNHLPHDEPHAFVRPSEAFQENRLEHDHELREVHVVSGGAAVEHQWAEDHVHEQRVGDRSADDLAGRGLAIGEVQFVMLLDLRDELAEAVNL